VTGGVAASVVLVVLLAELHVFTVARNRRVARRRRMLAPLMAALFLVFAVAVGVTIGEALGAR
jgi:uncharacterized membrane protein